MFPLFWWNNTITCKIYSYSPVITIYNSRIMIIFFIWYFLLFISLIHSFSLIVFIFFWIFVLFILPIFWNYNSIIPKIITYSITIFIPYLWIMLLLFTWYNSFYSLFHSLSLSIFIFFRIIIILT